MQRLRAPAAAPTLLIPGGAESAAGGLHATDGEEVDLETQQGGAGLEQALNVVRQHARLIATCFVLTLVVAFAYSEHEAKRYTATAALVFGSEAVNQQAAGLPAVDSSDDPAQQNTNLKLVELGGTATRTARTLGRGMTKQQVSESVSASAPGESNIVDVSATASSPALAARIATTYAEQFVSGQQQGSQDYYLSALRLVEGQLASIPASERTGQAAKVLDEREQSLRILAALPGDVRVAQMASVPTSPSSPSVKRDTLIGGLLGLMLGLAWAFGLERFDLRVRQPKELEALYGLPLLGVVPEDAVVPPSSTRPGEPLASRPAAVEAFQLIRARLRYFNVDRELRTLLISSPSSGEGKTTVALNLARAAATTGSRVLLIEADMRRPTVAGRLGLRAGPGLCDLLTGAVSLERVTQSYIAENPKKVDLGVIVAGAKCPPSPSLLTESQAMETLLEHVHDEYDLVIVDTPELNSVTDAFPLLRKVDGVIIVGRAGSDRREAALLRETLQGTGARILGVIANDFGADRVSPYADVPLRAHATPRATTPLPAGAVPTSQAAPVAN